MSAVADVQPRVAHGPRLAIDLSAIAANTRLFAERTPGALMAVVKADGFGHGADDVARTAIANGASWLGVTTIDEALALRRSGLRVPTLSWLNPLDADFGAAIASGVDLAVPGRDHLAAITRSGIGARIHLHLDTGMARDGCAPEDWAGLCRMARRAEQAGTVRVVGLMGHLGCADEPDDPDNAAGRSRFSWGLARAREAGLRPPLRHLAATAATLNDSLSHHTLNRVGAGLVGIDPSHTTVLRPAMTLTAPVVGVRRVRAGTPVGYGHAWSATRRTHLALLPLGYADGLPRATGRPRRGVPSRTTLPGRGADLDGPGRGGRRRPADPLWARPRSSSDQATWASRRSPSGRPGPTRSSTRSSPASAPGWADDGETRGSGSR